MSKTHQRPHHSLCHRWWVICNASLVHYRETVLCCLCVDVTLTLSWKLSQRIKLKWRRWFGSVTNVIKTCSTKRPGRSVPSFLTSGQQNPAFARKTAGIIEVADGSRRRKTAIITGCDYRVLVGDLDDEQMQWLSQVGNDYRPTSAYERGKNTSAVLTISMATSKH